MKRLQILCAIAACVLVVGTVVAQFGGSSDAPSNTAKKSDKPAAEKPSAQPAASSHAKAESTGLEFCQCTQGDSSAVLQIERALAGQLNKAGLDYTDAPLKEVADALSSDYGIPVQLDRNALEEAGVGVDAKVTVNLHNISLRSALRLMLKSLGITSIIQDEVLLITTKEAAEKELKICVYDARKIITDASDKNVELLIETVKACVNTDTWATNGGGQAEILPIPSGLFVVTQTQAVHQEIHDLLATIQRMNGK